MSELLGRYYHTLSNPFQSMKAILIGVLEFKNQEKS